MKIHPVVAELFHLDGQTDMMKLAVAFYNFANAPKKRTLYLAQTVHINAVIGSTNICIFKQLTVAKHTYVNLHHSKI